MAIESLLVTPVEGRFMSRLKSFFAGAPRPPVLGQQSRRETQWSYTENVEDAIERERMRNKYGDRFFDEYRLSPNPLFVHEYKGRPIIGRDRKINGGVYVTYNNKSEPLGEAIVVDDKKSETLKQVYDEFFHLFERAVNQGENRGVAMNLALQLAKQKMPYSKDGVDKTLEKRGVKDGGKISLGAFLRDEAGVCRHQALLVGYLLEKLTESRHLGGSVSVDRNFVPNEGGHAWTRYTNSRGVVYIIDPAQDYIGRLDDITGEQWFYNRPNE